jgi:hypothetical protein
MVAHDLRHWVGNVKRVCDYSLQQADARPKISHIHSAAAAVVKRSTVFWNIVIYWAVPFSNDKAAPPALTFCTRSLSAERCLRNVGVGENI